MKRYIFGLLAIVIAAGMVAFTKTTKEVKPYASHLFYYTPTTFGKASVETNSNWQSNPAIVPECDGAKKACRIAVDENYTELVNNVRMLKTSGSVLAIDAVPGAGSSTDFVPQISTSTGITAKADRP